MPRYAALLRGVNVGKGNRVPMAEWRTLLEALGCARVRTLLNSGNVVFTPAGRPAADAGRIRAAILDELGVDAPVTVLSGRALAAAVAANPLEQGAKVPAHLLLAVVRDAKAMSRIRPLARERWAPEAIAVGKGVAYLWCAKGLAGPGLWAAVNRAGGEDVTARNLSTLGKLLALVEAD